MGKLVKVAEKNKTRANQRMEKIGGKIKGRKRQKYKREKEEDKLKRG